MMTALSPRALITPVVNTGPLFPYLSSYGLWEFHTPRVPCHFPALTADDGDRLLFSDIQSLEALRCVFQEKKPKIPRKRLRIILTVLLPFLLPPSPFNSHHALPGSSCLYLFFPFLSITSQLCPRVTTVMYVRGAPPCFLDSFIGWLSCTRKEEGDPPSLADIVVVMCVEGNLDERMCNVGLLYTKAKTQARRCPCYWP